MTGFVPLSLLAMAVRPLQAPAGADEIRNLAAAPRSMDSLTVLVAQRPDDAREAVRRLLERAVTSTDTDADSTLLIARRLAGAYLVAWRDSFLLRQVTTFEAWPVDRRREKIAVDSVRRAGNDALPREGVVAALARWRESFQRAVALDDSAGIAAALGNIGAGLYIGRDLDSAVAYLEQARVLAERIGDSRTAGNALGTLASVSKDRGDWPRADSLYHRALEIRARTGDTRGAAADWNNLGLIAQSLGNMDSARSAFTAALTLNRKYGRLEPAATNLANLANVSSLQGDYADATSRYAEALAIKRQLGSRAGAALVLHDVGLLELRRGDYPAARSALAEATAIYREVGPAGDAALTQRDLASADAAMGNLQSAREELRAAELFAGPKSPPRLSAQLAIARGDLAALLNAPAEAEREYARAEEWFRQAYDTAGQAAARQGRGSLALWRENYAHARVILGSALDEQERRGDRRAAAITRLQLGVAERGAGDTSHARRTLGRARDAFRELDDPVGEAGAFSALGALEEQAGRPVAAESSYRHGLDVLGSRRAPAVSWQLHAGLGHALWWEGALADAERELAAAIAASEQVSRALPLEERRAAYRADKWDIYGQLALIEHALGRDAAAFEISERMRARQMLDLLARGRVTANSGTTASAREQDLRYQIAELTRRLEHEDFGEPRLRDATPTEAARAALSRAESAYAELVDSMRQSQPEYTSLVSGAVTTWREVAPNLAPDEALLEYLITDSLSLVFVGTVDSVVALEVPVGRHALAALVDYARSTLTHTVAVAAPDRWRAPMGHLFADLIAPVEAAGLLRGKHRLLIVPHAELHYIPFGALLAPTGVRRFLIERFEIAYLPSASVWARLRERTHSIVDDRVLALAPHSATLPGTRMEVEAIRRIFGTRADVFVGAAASTEAFQAEAPTHGIVHLATHGVLNDRNPLFSYVSLSAPDGADGRLEVHDVFGLTLNARLVVLGACQTGAGSGALADVPSGDDWVGLVQAFHNAGASHVIATLWPVDDRATAGFMDRFYRALEGGRSEAGALAEAQRFALRRPESGHPLYWAGFVLSGSR